MLILYIVLGVVAGVVLSLVAAYVALSLKNPNKVRPDRVDGNGYVKAVGTNIYDGDLCGNFRRLRKH